MAKSKITLFDGIMPTRTLDLDEVYCISSQGGLPDNENLLAIHLTDNVTTFFASSVIFS